MTKSDQAGEMRAEYDFSGGARGKYAERYARRFGVKIGPEWLVGGHTVGEFLDNFPSVSATPAAK